MRDNIARLIGSVAIALCIMFWVAKYTECNNAKLPERVDGTFDNQDTVIIVRGKSDGAKIHRVQWIRIVKSK